MKKLIVAICAIIVTITAAAQYEAINTWGFSVRLHFNDNTGSIVRVDKHTSFVEVRSQMKAEKIFRNLDNLADFEVCFAPFPAEASTYDYRADNLTDAVKMLIKAIRAN